jgi:hypothetical protein
MKFSSCGKNALYIILPAVFVALSLGSVQRKSPTYDETVHLFAGYAYLKWGDYRVNPEHPPLVKMLAAAPLLVLDLDTSGITPRERHYVQRDKNYGWVLAHRFVFLDNDAETLFFYARIVMVLFAVALALCVADWTRNLYGAEAGIVALFLCCLDPNIIAHAAIVQTDVPFALVFFSATYFFWRSLNELTWFNLLVTATLFSIAAVTKFSFVVILPIWLILGSVKIFAAGPLRSAITVPPEIGGRWRKGALVAVILIFSLMLGYLMIWATYQFRFDAILFQRGQLPAVDFKSDSSWWTWLLQLCREYLLLPEAMLFGLGDAYRRMERTAYLLGEISHHGFWLYFPIAFLAKTPVPTVVLTLIALGYTLLRRPKLNAALFLLAPALIFLALAVWSRLNVGWRHILPMYPFLFVWIAGTTATIWHAGQRLTKLGFIFLGVWLCTSTLWAYPNYLAYFNEAVGGSSRGRGFLVESSLDWGQDLKALKDWMSRNQVEKIQLAYFGTADPAYYKINADYLPGSAYVTYPEPDDVAGSPPYVAISETFLAGLYLDRPDRYARFREREPVAILGHSIRVYKVSD